MPHSPFGKVQIEIVRVSLAFRNIRFWDIPAWDCKSCLVFEAASENQGLHSRIQAVSEAAQAGKTGFTVHPGGGCETDVAPPIIRLQV